MADKVEDIEVDKVDAKEADMVVKIPNEDFFDVTLAIGDSYGDKGQGWLAGLHNLCDFLPA